MIILVVLFWLISYSAGIVCLALTAITYRRHPDRSSRSLLFLLTAFYAAVVPLTLKSAVEASNLLWTIRSAQFEAIIISLTLISQIGFSLLIAAFPLFIHARLQKERRFIDRIVLYISISLAILLAADVLLFSLTGTAPFGFISIGMTLLISMLFPLAIGYSLLLVLLNRKKVLEKNTALVLCLGGVVLLLELLRRELYPGFNPGATDILIHYVLPGACLLLNVILLAHLIKRMFAPASPDLNQALLTKLRFSPREIEVITHLVTGASYKEIGDRLYISLATVQSHITRIYQKAGVRSKVELLRLLTGY